MVVKLGWKEVEVDWNTSVQKYHLETFRILLPPSKFTKCWRHCGSTVEVLGVARKLVEVVLKVLLSLNLAAVLVRCLKMWWCWRMCIKLEMEGSGG